MKNSERSLILNKPFDSELVALLHPVRAFSHPEEVVDDPGLTLTEKRAILASWASDACAVEASPGLRRVPSSGQIVSIDEILEALRELDRRAGDTAVSWARRRARRASIEAFRERRMQREEGSCAGRLH